MKSFRKALYKWGGGRGGQTRLARATGLSDATISTLLSGNRRASLAVALLIESSTGGAIRAEWVPLTPHARGALKKRRAAERAARRAAGKARGAEASAAA